MVRNQVGKKWQNGLLEKANQLGIRNFSMLVISNYSVPKLLLFLW